MKNWRGIAVFVLLGFLLIGQVHASAPIASYVSKGHSFKKSEAPGFIWESRDIPATNSIARLHSLGGNWMTENNILDGTDSSFRWNERSFSTAAFADASRTGYYSKSYLKFIYPFHRFW